jgi:transcriptional regulator with XRE-family HTH domain
MITIVCRIKVFIGIKIRLMNRDLLKKFGKKLKTIRIKRSLSQEKLAEEAGVHRTYIGMVERGEKNITLLNIKRMAKALGVTVSKLLEGL